MAKNINSEVFMLNVRTGAFKAHLVNCCMLIDIYGFQLMLRAVIVLEGLLVADGTNGACIFLH